MAAKQIGTMSPGELAGFFGQLAMLVRAGISSEEALRLLRDDAQSQPERELLDRLLAPAERGEPLSAAMREAGGFPSYAVNMIEIGEQSGRLDEVLGSLASYYEREDSLGSMLKSAVTYPLIMLGMMLLVILVLSVKVLPIFSQVFAQLGADLPSLALGALQLGGALKTGCLVLVALLALLLASALALRSSEGGRHTLIRIFSVLPATRRLSMTIASGRFVSALALMLQSAVDPARSLELAARLVSHPALAARVEDCRRRLGQGNSFADSVRESGIFSGAAARMVAVGFKTGSADAVMGRLAARYEEEIDSELSRLVGVVEPTLVIILSVAVGMILLSVMLPLMGIMSSIG
ncbi:type IV pilus assembly protein PilC [Ruminococcaceae bacterium D5]|nr:type IV pilus assembly protein PilC [Ruminococcaceae bacterium D5]